APPELSTTALTMPDFATCSLHNTGFALHRLAVKTLAESNRGPSFTTTATSLVPDDLRPATTPLARNPRGPVTVMAPPPPGSPRPRAPPPATRASRDPRCPR